MKYSKSKSDINEAAVLQPHNGYTDMRKQYENWLSSVEDGHTELSIVSMEYQIEGFVGEEEAHHIRILKSKSDINEAAVL